jgi:LysM repeat protein
MTEYVSGDSGQTFFIQDGYKRQILDTESLIDSRIGVPALSSVKISAFKNLPWGKPIIRKGVSFTNLATNKLAVYDGLNYYDVEPAATADIDFSKWLPKSTGSMLGEAMATIAAPVKIKTIVNSPEGTQYLLTKDGKRKVLDGKTISKDAPVVSAELLALIPDVAAGIESVFFAKSAAEKNVHLIIDGIKRPLLNSADTAKFARGVTSTKVQTLSDSALAQIPLGSAAISPGSFVKVGSASYLIDGFKRSLLVADSNQAALLGLANPKVLTSTQAKGYAKSTKLEGIKFVCDSKYYVAITGKLYPLSDLDASHYPGRGLTLDTMTCAALTKTTSTLGRFLKGADGKIYLIEAQTKHLIKNVAAYEKLRGTLAKAILAGPYLLSKIPAGKSAGTSVSNELFDSGLPIVPGEPTPSASPKPSPSLSASPSASPSASASPKPSASPIATASPGPSASPRPSASPSPTATIKPKTYTVVAGDYLNKIAAKFGVTASALMTANKITNANSIRIGQVLIIP